MFLKVTAVFLTISLCSLSYTYAAADQCDRYLEDILMNKASALNLFKKQYAQEIKELIQSGRLNPTKINQESLVYGRDNKTGKLVFMLMDEAGYTLLFDTSLSKNWEQLESQEIGFVNPYFVDNNFEILSRNLVPRSVKADVLLLPWEEYGPTAVKEFLAKNTNSNKIDKIRYWKDELQYLVNNQYYDRASGPILLSASSLSKAIFIDVSVKGIPEEQLTLMVVDNQIFYLSKKRPGQWINSKAKQGTLNVESFGYNAKANGITFLDKNGLEYKVTNNGLDLIGEEDFSKMNLDQLPAPQKVFLSLYQDEIQEIFNMYKLNLDQLAQLQVFKVDEKEQDFVVLVNNVPFYFNKNGAKILNSNKTWEPINSPSIGYLNRSRFQVPLNDNYIMVVEKNEVKVFPAKEKSFESLKTIFASAEVPEANKQLLAEFGEELKELLATTDIAVSELANGSVFSAIDKKTGQKVKFLNMDKTNIIFTSEVPQNDTFYKNKKYNILSEQSFFGMLNQQERHFEVPSQTLVIVNSQGIKVKPFNSRQYAENFINSIITDKYKTFPHLTKAMVSQFKKEVIELIEQDKIEVVDLVSKNTSLAYAPKSDTLFWSITSKDKTFLFNLDKNANEVTTEFLKMDTTTHGNKIVLDNGLSLIVSQSIGFQGDLIKKEQLHELEDLKGIQSAKSEFALDKKLNQDEIDNIFNASMIGYGEAGADKVSMARPGNFTDDQMKRKKKSLLDSGFFTQEEIDILIDFNIL